MKPKNRKIEYGGKSLTVLEWAKETGLKYTTIYNRIDRGWDEGRAVSYPKIDHKLYLTHNGETLTVKEWAARAGISLHAFYMRVVKLKWPFQKALNTPVRKQEELEPLELGAATHFGQRISPSAYDS